MFLITVLVKSSNLWLWWNVCRPLLSRLNSKWGCQFIRSPLLSDKIFSWLPHPPHPTKNIYFIKSITLLLQLSLPCIDIQVQQFNLNVFLVPYLHAFTFILLQTYFPLNKGNQFIYKSVKFQDNLSVIITQLAWTAFKLVMSRIINNKTESIRSQL